MRIVFKVGINERKLSKWESCVVSRGDWISIVVVIHWVEKRSVINIGFSIKFKKNVQSSGVTSTNETPDQSKLPKIISFCDMNENDNVSRLNNCCSLW